MDAKQKVPPARIELATLRLWDSRAANCATGEIHVWVCAETLR